MTATLPVALAVSGATVSGATVFGSTVSGSTTQPLAQRALPLLLEADHTVEMVTSRGAIGVWQRNPLASLASASGHVDQATAAANQGRPALQLRRCPPLQQGGAHSLRGVLP